MSTLNKYDPVEENWKTLVVGKKGDKGDQGPKGDNAVLSFDAGGDINAPRPNVASTTIVFWFNTPGQPTNLGQFDVWEDES